MAEPEGLGDLRRIVRRNLTVWGLPHLVEPAQLCATELVTNVITHVGRQTPTTLAVSMSGRSLRIEVIDPAACALPTRREAGTDDESGRGLVLVEALSERWGVVLRADRKVTWCELATGLHSEKDHIEDLRAERAELLLSLYCFEANVKASTGRVGVAVAEEAAIDVIADLLHWLRSHGRDPDGALDHAWMHFEAEISERP
ncbi:ATP-binding protein [Streptomyces sp. Edi4]|uniref:ATP-binding protein n=1 Tax=Streptomyces sp. Edi4 TaxID=3162527 RepID=UPI00330679CF